MRSLNYVRIIFSVILFTITPITLLAENLSSSNYTVENPSVDSGGENSNSTNYNERESIGGSNDSVANSTNYNVFPGFIQHAYPGVPGQPTLVNTGGTLYNALDFIVNTAGNQTDTNYAIAISSDNFTTTNFIQADDTVGSSPVWQTYTAWGSGTGQRVTGLIANTTYKIKVKARYGTDTETAYSITASDSTGGPTLTVSFAGVNSGTTIAGATTTITSAANTINYGIPVVKLNNEVLSPNYYEINSTQGRIYLQNSITPGSSLKIILPLAKQVSLTIQSDSDIVDAFIYLTDGATRYDANGNPNGTQIYTWDDGLYHTPVVKLQGVEIDPDVIPYTIDANRGGIAFLPTLDGNTYADDDLEVVITHIGDEITGKLSGKRIKDIDAGTFTSGTLDTRRMYGLSHVGQNRYLEPASLRPSLRLFDSGDHTTYYAEVLNSELQHTTNLYTIYPSVNFIGDNILIGTSMGIMQSSDYINASYQSSWVRDYGQPVQFMDNLLIPKGTNHFATTYVRTWNDSLSPRTGRVYYTQNQGLSWSKLKMPTIATDTETITTSATAFQVSTERVEVTTGLVKTYEWYKVLNLGTDRGLYSATIKEGLADDEWEWDYQSYISTDTKVYSILEIVTLHESWDGDGNLTETFDRSLYVGAETGFFVNGFLVSDSVVKGIYWLKGGSNPRVNNLLWHTDNEVFITHTAELVETSNERYYNHPLAFFEQGDIVQMTAAKSVMSSNISNFATSCPAQVDGVSLLTGDRILVIGQTDPIENGVYEVTTVGTGSNGAWARVVDMASTDTVASEFYIRVTNGDVYGGSAWHIADTAVVDTDPIVWNNLILRAIYDTSRVFNDLHQHAFDPSVYFALSNSNIYRIDDVYDEDTTTWMPLVTSQMIWEEVYQKSAQCIVSNASGDYGTLFVGTNRGLWKSAKPLWDLTDTNSPWIRTSQQFLSANEPTVYNAIDFTEYQESETYSNALPIPTLRHSVAYQAFVWDAARSLFDNYVFEKDYTTFWVDPWISDNSDVVVYIGNTPSDISYSLDPDTGKIQFISSVGREHANDIKITIIRPGAFISDIGTTPHGEMPNSFVTAATHSTVLSEDFTVQDEIIHVADDTAIPVGTDYIELRNATSRERLNIVVNPNTRQITLARPRSGVVTFPKTITKVYLVSIKSVLGIEDEITKRATNQTYHLNSLGGVNTLQLSIASKNAFTSPLLFDNFGSYTKTGYAADRGPKNAMFFDFNTDTYDTSKSSSAFYVGNEPSTGLNSAVEPNAVYSIYNASVSGNDMRLGTDSGLWRYISASSRWTKESALDDATKTYFIQNVDSVLTAGTDTGAHQKDNSNNWALNPTYPQTIFAQLDNQPWKTSGSVTYTYDAWGKDDGLAFVLRASNSSDFISDHFDDLDERRVYGLHHDQFIRIASDGSQTKVNALYMATEDGVFAVTDGSRGGNYSSVLTGRQMFDTDKPTMTITLPSGGTQTVSVKFYAITKSQRPNSIPLVLLSNNGIYIVRNWRWCDPDPKATPPLLDFYAESHSLSNISCYCYYHKSEGTNPTVYTMFIGTEKGVYRSYNDGYTWERCERIAGGDTAVYSLVSSGTGILAATELGLFYSDDDGDTWSRPSDDGNGVAEYDYVVSTAVNFDGGYLAQTFELDAISNDISKVALYLSPVDLTNNPAYEASLNNTLSVSIYNTSAGSPNALIAPTGTPDTISAADVLYHGWYYANISVTGLTPGNTYALVVKETIAPGGISLFKWHTSKVSNSYSDGQAFNGGAAPTWTALTNQDYYFRVYQPEPPVATETIVPVGFYDNTYDIGWFSGEGRGWIVSDDGRLLSNISPLLSVVVDDSQSMRWNDPSQANTMEIEVPNLISTLFGYTEVSLAGSVFAELSGETFYPSFADFWIFGTNILERTEGYTNDLTGTLQVAASALYERGLKSESLDTSSIAFSGLSPQSLIDAIIKDSDEDNNVARMKRIVEYMENIAVLRHDDIVDYWDSLSVAERSAWGTTGGYLDENIPYYADVREFVLSRYLMMLVPVAVLICDGDNYLSGSASDVATTLLSTWDADGVQPYIVGLTSGHKQQDLHTIATNAYGRHLSILNDTDWADFVDGLTAGSPYTFFKGTWTRSFDYDNPTYIKLIHFSKMTNVGSSCTLQYRYTFDRINWSPWQTHSGGDVNLGLKVLGIEYHISLDEGMNVGNKIFSYVTSLYHVEVSPGYKYLFTLPQTIDGMLFEYLLTADKGVDWPDTAELQWGLIRGNSVDFSDFEYIRTNRKGTLPNRQGSLQYTDEVIQDKLDTITSDFHYYYVKNSTGQTVTWSTDDLITVYVLVLGEYREVIPDGYDGDFGFVYFSNEQPSDLIIKVTITTPRRLYTSSGEATTTKDGRTYTLANGSWPKDATAIVLVNGNIIRGGYYLSPDNGTVTFTKERERTDLVTVYIQFTNEFRVGLQIKNYSTIADVTPSNFGLFYTVKPNGRIPFLYLNTDSPTIVDGLVSITPDGYNEPTNSQRLIVEYAFDSTDGNTERNTTTTWWRRRPIDPATYSMPEDPDYPGQNFQQMTYENIETVGMTNRNFPEYNNRTVERKADVGDNDWFKSGDIIRVKVTPSDGISYGLTYQSDATTITGDGIPYVSGVTIAATGKTEEPASSGNFYVPAGTELRAYYVYADPDTGTTTVNGTTHTSLVEWFINDSKDVYSNEPVIAAGVTTAGQSYSFRVTPRDGSLPNAHIGIPVMSENVVIR